MNLNSTFAQDRRTEMVGAAERRNLVRAARAAHKADAAGGRVNTFFANLFTRRPQPAPIVMPAPSPQPATDGNDRAAA
jgi:hypothetical protein